ncbi:hypothetical protein ACSNOK_15335 [Streptomyces sp. URMC 126]|uniref:hypothetical protein n=1 Tax=Streptomyces sp. URMC 126 TaxID=3423401 RepID=UPI003F1AC8F5
MGGEQPEGGDADALGTIVGWLASRPVGRTATPRGSPVATGGSAVVASRATEVDGASGSGFSRSGSPASGARERRRPPSGRPERVAGQRP